MQGTKQGDSGRNGHSCLGFRRARKTSYFVTVLSLPLVAIRGVEPATVMQMLLVRSSRLPRPLYATDRPFPDLRLRDASHNQIAFGSVVSSKLILIEGLSNAPSFSFQYECFIIRPGQPFTFGSMPESNHRVARSDGSFPHLKRFIRRSWGGGKRCWFTMRNEKCVHLNGEPGGDFIAFTSVLVTLFSYLTFVVIKDLVSKADITWGNFLMNAASNPQQHQRA